MALPNDSILEYVKRHMPVEAENTDFDAELIDHINAAFDDLLQIGVGPAEGYSIDGAAQTWSDYFRSTKRYASAQEVVWMRVKLVFDPPASSTALQALQSTCTERMTRLRDQVDHYEEVQNGICLPYA